MPKPEVTKKGASIKKVGQTTSGQHGSDPNAQPKGRSTRELNAR